MIIKGRAILVLGDDVDTDIIYPGRYLNITDKLETPKHLFEIAHPDLIDRLTENDILVARGNFGCGSSREQAATAIKYSGIGAVLATSFARIFYRNCINIGLPLLTIGEESYEKIALLNELEIDLTKGLILNISTGEKIPSAALSDQALTLIKAGGLIPYLQSKYKK